MTREEQLQSVKDSLNIKGTSLDPALGPLVDDVKVYMTGAGVKTLVLNSELSIGCICRGVADLYINNELSQYFYQRLTQLVLTPETEVSVENEGSSAV